MALRPNTVRFARNGFVREETFLSKADADHWLRMMSETLELPQALSVDLSTYAEGLANSVRAYGGAYTRKCWLSGEASPEQWARGRPVAQEMSDQLRTVLSGTPKG